MLFLTLNALVQKAIQFLRTVVFFPKQTRTTNKPTTTTTTNKYNKNKKNKKNKNKNNKTQTGGIHKHLFFESRKSLFMIPCQHSARTAHSYKRPTKPVVRPEYGAVGMNGLSVPRAKHKNGIRTLKTLWSTT